MTFNDLLQKQAELDKMIDRERPNGFKPRERTREDIKLSMIAEIIEFNEETLETHKTWKEKTFDLDKAKEEAVDILFFYLQLLNHKYTDKHLLTLIINDFYEKRQISYLADRDKDLLNLIHNITQDNLTRVSFGLTAIFANLGMTKQDIIDEYMRKWHKNVKRIEEEWTMQVKKNNSYTYAEVGIFRYILNRIKGWLYE